jgi:hypothetical protein
MNDLPAAAQPNETVKCEGQCQWEPGHLVNVCKICQEDDY